MVEEVTRNLTNQLSLEKISQCCKCMEHDVSNTRTIIIYIEVKQITHKFGHVYINFRKKTHSIFASREKGRHSNQQPEQHTCIATSFEEGKLLTFLGGTKEF